MSARSATTDELVEASTSEVASAVLDLLNENIGEPWYLVEIALSTGYRLADVAVAVARLTVAGELAHDGIGSGYWVEPGAR